MSGYGLFQTSILGMESQTHRLNTIGYNIANVNTGGFKRTDTRFQTVLSDTIDTYSDFGGVKPYALATNDTQGLIQQSSRSLDVAISGSGFFAVQPSFTGTTEVYYTRDGSFEINTVDGQTSSVTADDGNTITVNNGYIVDKNGYFVRGVPINEDGTFSSGVGAPMRVDQYAFIDQGQPTTAAQLELNLPSTQDFGDSAQTVALATYDSNSTRRDVTFDFTRQLSNNRWRIDARADNLTSATLTPSSTFSLTSGAAADTVWAFDGAANSITVRNNTTGNNVGNAFEGLAAGDTITIASSTSNNGTFTVSEVINNGATLVLQSGVTTETSLLTDSVSLTSNAAITDALIFNSNGTLTSPTTLTFNATWDDAATSSFTIDIGDTTQFAGDFTLYRTDQNGLGLASITDVSFNSEGIVLGSFADGTQRALYKMPLFSFTNPNGLDSDNGMIFKETEESGTATAFFADESSRATIVGNAVEISNVDLAVEFSAMIQAQNTYNMNATSFKTIDEMTTVARDLKA